RHLQSEIHIAGLPYRHGDVLPLPGLKALRVHCDVITSGIRSEKRYAPVLFVEVVCVLPVSLLLSVTVAFATAAPLGSVTVPITSPDVRDWATEVVGTNNEATTTAESETSETK